MRQSVSAADALPAGIGRLGCNELPRTAIYESKGLVTDSMARSWERS
jgi:hypothetical protein